MRIAVVGAGVVGASVAWELTERGHAVVLIDRAAAVGQETSYANGGQLHAGHAAPWNPPGVLRDALAWLGRADSPLRLRPARLLRSPAWALRFLANARAARHRRHARANAELAAYSLRALDAVCERTGIELEGRGRGALKLFDEQRALGHGLAEAEAVADLGIRHRALTPEQAVAREPALAEGAERLAGAIEFPDDGCGDALHFTEAVSQQAAAAGAELRLGTTVHHLLGGRRGVSGVATDRGPITADAVVIAAGSYAPRLTRPLGLRLPIEPIKGYSVTLPLAGADGAAPQVPIIDDARKIVVTRLGERLRIAGKAEIAGFDTRLRERDWRAVREQGLARFPRLAQRLAEAPSHPWAGLRPMTCDGPPILGPTAIPGLHLAAGVGHLGWTFAPGGARLVADQLEGRPCAISPVPFHAARYRRPPR